MNECGNNIELVSSHQSKIADIKKGIPKSVLRLFGVLPKKEETKKGSK